MNWTAQCAVIIPCLNESAAISALVRAVALKLPRVLVVDDGSIDSTGVLAEEAGAEVIRHEVSGGKGAALRAGWDWAAKNGFQWALAMDGDGQHSADDIPAFLDRAGATNADLVIGNRMADPRGMPWLRRFVNRWMSRRISRSAGRELPDTQCGFRLIRLEALSEMAFSTAHFEIESEVLLAFARAGRKIEFVPIRVIYKSEQSKIHPLLDTVRWFRWWKSC